MQVALRARRRQYEIKALIEASEIAAQKLEELVVARPAAGKNERSADRPNGGAGAD
jgi:hypothetical protein